MSSANGAAVPGAIASEVEVMAKATRRRFSAEYKRKILREAEACTQPGEIGALLRREGSFASLYSSILPNRTMGESVREDPYRAV